MEFQFDLVWRENLETGPSDLAESLSGEPVVVINPAAREDPRVLKNLYHP